jgi:hypothetical protein
MSLGADELEFSAVPELAVAAGNRERGQSKVTEKKWQEKFRLCKEDFMCDLK